MFTAAREATSASVVKVEKQFLSIFSVPFLAWAGPKLPYLFCLKWVEGGG